MAMFVYVIALFFSTADGGVEVQFDAERTFFTIEECLAALPQVVGAEVGAALRDRLEGAACLSEETAEAAQGSHGAP